MTVAQGDAARRRALESWAAGAAPAAAQVRGAEDDVALIMYTSGTTGRPKGAMLTHGNLWWNNVSCMHTLDVLTDDVTLVAAPIFHIGGLNVTTLTAFQKGALVVLHRGFDPARALADIAAHRVTTMFGVPAMFLFMAQHPAFADERPFLGSPVRRRRRALPAAGAESL